MSDKGKTIVLQNQVENLWGKDTQAEFHFSQHVPDLLV
jgi:hypothetical protein